MNCVVCSMNLLHLGRVIRFTVFITTLQASPRLQTEECLIKEVSEKLDQGNVTESVFDAVQAKVMILMIETSEI